MVAEMAGAMRVSGLVAGDRVAGVPLSFYIHLKSLTMELNSSHGDELDNCNCPSTSDVKSWWHFY